MIDFGTGTYASAPRGSGGMDFLPLADANGNAYATNRLGFQTAVATRVNLFPLDIVLHGPLVRYASLGSVADNWQIVKPLQIRMSADTDGTLLASDDYFLNYGVGNTIGAAIANYVVTLVEFYHLLSANVKDNPLDQPLVDRLRSYICTIS